MTSRIWTRNTHIGAARNALSNVLTLSLVTTTTGETSVPNQALDEEKTLARLQTLVRSEHWLATYVSDLLSAHDLSAGIDFRTAEQLLAAEKEQFEKDLAIARRMLRVYGKQVMAENLSQTAYAPSNG